MGKDIPKDVLGDRPQTPEEFAAQQDRIDKWLTEKAADDAAKKFEEGS
jgi:hypothetical protein